MKKKFYRQGLKKAFFDAWNWLLAMSTYAFFKSDKNCFLLSCNHFYVSCDALSYTYANLDSNTYLTMYNMHKKCEEKLLRDKTETTSRFEKA